MKQEDVAVREQANPANDENAPSASAHEAVADDSEAEAALVADAPAPEPPAQMSLLTRLDGMINTRRQRMLVYTVIAALVGLLTAWFFASMFPNYLLYETSAIKADAAVLFLGPDEDARRKQVNDLVVRDMAKFVIVPYEGIIFETQVSQAPVNPAKTAAISRGIRANTQRPYVEQTHIEVLQARALMERIGATSANFVSSPYNMRRIKIMTDQVFDDEKYEIAFVPTAYEPRYVPWFFAWQDVKWVFSEWGKIAWYFLYSPFV